MNMNTLVLSCMGKMKTNRGTYMQSLICYVLSCHDTLRFGVTLRYVVLCWYVVLCYVMLRYVNLCYVTLR